jgi:hypothetical protein
MPRLLFIVHGMGVHDTAWADPTVAHLKKIPSDYGYEWFDANGPLEDHVKCVPISYDKAFTELLDQWAESADELEQFAHTEGVGIAKSIDFLQGASAAEQQFFWTSVVDVLLYRLFPIVTANVRDDREEGDRRTVHRGNGGGLRGRCVDHGAQPRDVRDARHPVGHGDEAHPDAGRA